MISIIIPAHNEEKVITTTLKELLPGVSEGEIEVLVVCNGCTDNTKSEVEAFGEAIKCIETSIASKTNALNLGDAAATGFPRIYQDADVVLSVKAIHEIANKLKNSSCLAASPKMKMNFYNASWAVRSYYDIWNKLPYVKEGMIGTGVYALSEIGRQRFKKFPQIISDDGFIRAQFSKRERISVNTCHSIVTAPTNLNGLIKIKVRSRLGGYELKRKFPDLMPNKNTDYFSAFYELIKKIELWPKIAVYIYVNLVSRIKAKKLARKKYFSAWERDETSRNTVKKMINKKN